MGIARGGKMENRRAEYDGTSNTFSMENDGKMRKFGEEFWIYCRDNRIIPTVMCYNTTQQQFGVIRTRKSQLVEATNRN